MLVAAGAARGDSPEQPPDQLTLTDDLIAAVGGRPITGRRVEALVATGSDATHQAALRATDRLGSLRFELTGSLRSSDELADQNDAAARIEHHGERDVVQVYGSYATAHVPTTRRSFTTDSDAAAYGASWTAWRPSGRFELEASGSHTGLHDDRTTSAFDLETSAQLARASVTSRRLAAFGLDHELGAGITLARASGDTSEAELVPDMPTRIEWLAPKRRGKHRFLSAYIHDTLRVIESLDIGGGFVFEHWRWLTTMQPLPRSGEEQMDVEATAMVGSLLGPRLDALFRITPELGVTANAYRRLRTPSWHQRMRPVLEHGLRTAGRTDLRAETVTGAEAGPLISAGSIEARATAFWNEVSAPIATVTVDDARREIANLDHARELGLTAAASWRIAKPWFVGASYTFASTRITAAGAYPQLAGKQPVQAPRHRATATLAFDDPRIVTLTGVVRYVGRRYEDDRNTIALRPFAVVDAMVTRKLVYGLAGFIAVENLFDRRYVENVAGIDSEGAPRMFHVGVRLDSARW